MARRGRKPVYRDVPCPSCGSNHVVKNGKIRGRQFYLCRECGRKFVEGAKHHHDRSVRERALRMYANGMSMRAISRVLQVPLGTVFTWIKRYGGKKYAKLAELWRRARDELNEGVKVVDEMWTYFRRNAKAFYSWVFTGFVFSRKGMYVVFSVGDRSENTFQELAQCPRRGPGFRTTTTSISSSPSTGSCHPLTPTSPSTRPSGTGS
ncbi:MAG: hypothetical protein MjAS7_1184 [Metallosphaera javensis (ex Sakai et al. 2022)]|nr:MAG: hypothetical protein MjAS7_1184 [Metallosphaera javensis (ex Sakai et al. 2022)]